MVGDMCEDCWWGVDRKAMTGSGRRSIGGDSNVCSIECERRTKSEERRERIRDRGMVGLERRGEKEIPEEEARWRRGYVVDLGSPQQSQKEQPHVAGCFRPCRMVSAAPSFIAGASRCFCRGRVWKPGSFRKRGVGRGGQLQGGGRR